MADIETLKEKYKRQLDPFFDLLLERRTEMSKLGWDESVRRFEESVLKSPDQYLADLAAKEKEVLRAIIKGLFEELLSEDKV